MVFPLEALRASDRPLEFVMHELGAIIERMPADLRADVNTAHSITVTFTTE